MRNNNNNITKTFFHIFCIIIGTIFTFSGFVKAVDPLGTVYKIEDYLTAMGLDWMMWSSTYAAYILIILEMTTGIMLLLHIAFKWDLTIISLMMAFMTPLTLWIAIAEPVSDCGCFGDAVVISNWSTFWKNIAIDAMLVYIWIFRKSFYPWLTELPTLISAIIINLAVLAFCMYNTVNIPVIDFRPYHIGADILESMQLPEGAQQDEYKTTLIYSKDGVSKEFTVQESPYNDSTWTFVEQKTELIKKGDVLAIHDFSIVSTDGDDYTYDVLESEGITYLAVMYDLSKTKTDNLNLVDSVYAKALSENARFMALTSSSQLIDDFKKQFNIKYDFFLTDPIQLKTMVRANPGIVVLKGSKIIDKYNVNNTKKLKTKY